MVCQPQHSYSVIKQYVWGNHILKACYQIFLQWLLSFSEALPGSGSWTLINDRYLFAFSISLKWWENLLFPCCTKKRNNEYLGNCYLSKKKENWMCTGYCLRPVILSWKRLPTLQPSEHKQKWMNELAVILFSVLMWVKKWK